MYLESIDLSFIQPCTTDSKRIRIMSNLSKNISDIFPYLNSYIKTGIYNKKANTFVFNKEHIIITMFEESINVAKLLNETEAFEILDYVKDLEDKLKNAMPERVFITHSGCDDAIIDSVKAHLQSLNIFDEIHVTRAGGVVSSHCGPGTLGVLFISKN